MMILHHALVWHDSINILFVVIVFVTKTDKTKGKSLGICGDHFFFLQKH